MWSPSVIIRPATGTCFHVNGELVKLMKELNELDDAAISGFAEARKFDEVTVSLAVLAAAYRIAKTHDEAT